MSHEHTHGPSAGDCAEAGTVAGSSHSLIVHPPAW